MKLVKKTCIMINLQEKLCNTTESIKMVQANLDALVGKIVLCYLSFRLFLFVLVHMDGNTVFFSRILANSSAFLAILGAHEG